MDVAVTGSSGLIGTALVEELRRHCHAVRRLVRSPTGRPDEVRWDPGSGTIDTGGLAGVDAVVHLAGEGIAERRWSDEQKRRIRESRTSGTDLLARTAAALDPRPAVLLSASAVGYYGDRGDDELTEDSPPGTGFLPELVQAWEASTAAAVDAGIRTVCFRTGIVLAAGGGALARQLPLFKLGLGGRLGSGRQWLAWISLTDEVGALRHLLSADVAGPVNLTGPAPVTNAELTAALGRVLHRPARLPVPRFGPALLLGREAAEAVVFASAKVLPRRLQASGYDFRHATVEAALRHELGRPPT
jgi:uncharacterized protein